MEVGAAGLWAVKAGQLTKLKSLTVWSEPVPPVAPVKPTYAVAPLTTAGRLMGDEWYRRQQYLIATEAITHQPAARRERRHRVCRFHGRNGGTGSDQTVSDFNFVRLACLDAQPAGPNSIVLSWPLGVGGYVLQQNYQPQFNQLDHRGWHSDPDGRLEPTDRVSIGTADILSPVLQYTPQLIDHTPGLIAGPFRPRPGSFSPASLFKVFFPSL